MDYDLEIRNKLTTLKRLKKDLSDGFLLEEWKVNNSLIDIAIVNGMLIGYEIKSKKDTLYRLEKQMADYKKVFDKITIITDSSHVSEIKNICPPYVGIMITDKGFSILREANLNIDDLDFYSIASLLYKDELYNILTEKGFSKIKSKSRLELATIMGKELGRETSNLVRSQLKTRKSQGWKDYVNPWDKYIENPSLVLRPQR